DRRRSRSPGYSSNYDDRRGGGRGYDDRRPPPRGRSPSPYRYNEAARGRSPPPADYGGVVTSGASLDWNGWDTPAKRIPLRGWEPMLGVDTGPRWIATRIIALFADPTIGFDCSFVDAAQLLRIGARNGFFSISIFGTHVGDVLGYTSAFGRHFFKLFIVYS